MKTINVSWSAMVKLITIAVTLILFFAVRKMILNYFESSNTLILLPVLLIILVFLITLINAPISIEIGKIGFTLKKIIGKIEINYSDISNIGIYDPALSDIRLFGSGGLFGFIGIFYSKSLGRYHSFVGNSGQAFFVQLKNGKKYVFSAEGRDTVINSVSNFINH